MENKNNVVNNEVQENTEVEAKTFTQEEVDEILKGYKSQEEVNDIVNKRLARERKDIKDQIEAERREAEELAKLSEAEKHEKLFEKRVKEFEKREEEFEKTKKAFENERLLNETSKQLASKNLPIEFAEMLKGKDAESTFENINVFESKFNEALEKAITDRLKGSAPKVKTSLNTGITKEQFRGMSYMEKMDLYNKDKELFNQLNK